LRPSRDEAAKSCRGKPKFSRQCKECMSRTGKKSQEKRGPGRPATAKKTQKKRADKTFVRLHTFPSIGWCSEKDQRNPGQKEKSKKGGGGLLGGHPKRISLASMRHPARSKIERTQRGKKATTVNLPRGLPKNKSGSGRDRRQGTNDEKAATTAPKRKNGKRGTSG